MRRIILSIIFIFLFFLLSIFLSSFFFDYELLKVTNPSIKYKCVLKNWLSAGSFFFFLITNSFSLSVIVLFIVESRNELYIVTLHRPLCHWFLTFINLFLYFLNSIRSKITLYSTWFILIEHLIMCSVFRI